MKQANNILSGYLLTFQDILERLKWLSVRIVSSGGIKIGKIISLILFAVVPDHRKSLTDPLPLVS